MDVVSVPVPPLPRTVSLATGERLVVREAAAGDLPGLAGLYDRLDPEARHRRFFTTMPPRQEFLDGLLALAERGGLCVVVVDPGARADEAIVAEADVERIAGDEGDMAITVDGRWRGWLGAFLLDVVCGEAARRGIRNLRADILTCNRPMRALTRRRGEAFLPESDWQTVRVVFATAGTAPSWPAPEEGESTERRPRVLVELRSMSFEAVAELAASGFDTRSCTGRQQGAPACPLLHEPRECPLASGADVVLVALPDGEERDRLLTAHRECRPDVPVVAIDRRAGPLRGIDLAAAAERGLLEGRRRNAPPS